MVEDVLRIYCRFYEEHFVCITLLIGGVVYSFFIANNNLVLGFLYSVMITFGIVWTINVSVTLLGFVLLFFEKIFKKIFRIKEDE